MSSGGRVTYTEHGNGTTHELDAPDWSPNRLGYVERAELWAKLQALADIVDPGEYQDWQQKQRGSRTIIRNYDETGDE